MFRFLVCLVLASLLDRSPLFAQAPAVPSRPAAADRFGDPLPPGARARLGTGRFRHGEPVRFLAFAPDGKSLLSSAYRGPFVVWDVASGKALYRLSGNITCGPAMPFSRDGKTLMFLGPDRHVRLCDGATGKELRRLASPAANSAIVALSPDKRTLALLDGNQTLRLWDLKANKELRRLQGPLKVQPGQQPSYIHLLAFTPDGKRLIAAGMRGQELLVRLWDLATFREQPPQQWPSARLSGLVFSPDSKTLLIGEARGGVSMVDLATGKKVLQVRDVAHLTSAAAFSADGKTLALADTLSIVLVDPATGLSVRRLTAPLQGCLSLAFSHDGKTLAVGGYDHTIRLLDVATGQEIRPQPGHSAAVAVTSYSPDGRTIATASADLTVRLWDAATGKELRRFTHPLKEAQPGSSPQLLTFLRGGRALTVAWRDGMVCTWETATGKERFHGQVGKKGSWPVALSPDGKSVASQGPDGSVGVYDVSSGRELRRFSPPPGSGQQQAPSAVAFTQDGRTLVAGYGAQPSNPYSLQMGFSGPQPAFPGANAVVRLWELSSGRERGALTIGSPTMPVLQDGFRGGGFTYTTVYMTTSVSHVAFSPSGRTLALRVNGNLILWDRQGNREVRRIEGAFQGGGPAFSPDGRLMALGGDAGFTLWNVATGDLLCRVSGHQGVVGSLAFSPDGKSLVTGAADTSALIWDVEQLLAEGRRQRTELSPQRLEELWADLARDDAGIADRAIWALAAVPRRSVPFLKGRLRAVPPIDAAALEKLVADLNSGRYAVRQQATRKLQTLGEVAELALRKALEQGPTLEMRRRVEPLLAKIEAPVTAPEQLRVLRAVEALERAGTKEARAVLVVLAGGAPQARLTREAQDALERLGRRSVNAP